MAFGDGIDHEEGHAAVHVTGAEHAGQGGHHLFVGLDANRVAGVDAAILGQEGEIGSLADGPDHEVSRDDMLGVRDLVEIGASTLEPAEIDFSTQRTPTIWSSSTTISLKVRPGIHSTPSSSATVDFPFEAGHLAARLQADHAALQAGPGGRPSGRVQGHIAAAQHGDPSCR